MYCSDECSKKHRNLVHQIECSQPEMHENKAIAVDMILSAIETAGSVENLRQLLNSSTYKTLFDFDWSDSQDASRRKNTLLAVNALSIVRETEFTRSGPLKDLLSKPPFESLIQTDEDRDFMESFALKQLRILDTNLLDMKEHSRLSEAYKQRGTFGQSIGGGLFLFLSLFSHSCDPHVKRITVNNKIAFVVIRPVRAGEQVYISYGYSSYGMYQFDRQKNLMSYGFLCDCVACTEQYPMLINQPRMVYSYTEPDHELMTARSAIAEFRKTTKFIEKIIFQHPCYETTDMIVYCDHLLHQIAKNFLEEY
jgi:SET domain